MNNWLYAVMTIFTHRFNICSPKFDGRRCLSPPPGYAPGSSDDGYVVLNPFLLQLQTRRHLTPATKTNLAWLGQLRSQAKIFLGAKLLILGEQQYFVWDTASQSIK